MTSTGPEAESFELTVTITKSDATRANLRLVGDLTEQSAGLLEACVSHHLDSGRRFVQLDLSGLATVDEAGLGVIERSHLDFFSRRGTLIIRDARPECRELMKRLGLDQTLLIAAPAAFNPRPSA